MTNTMKPLILAVALIAVTAANAPTADAYSRWGPNGYTDNYSDFVYTDPYGGVHTGTIYGR